jgi:hypothetical protein
VNDLRKTEALLANVKLKRREGGWAR